MVTLDFYLIYYITNDISCKGFLAILCKKEQHGAKTGSSPWRAARFDVFDKTY